MGDVAEDTAGSGAWRHLLCAQPVPGPGHCQSLLVEKAVPLGCRQGPPLLAVTGLEKGARAARCPGRPWRTTCLSLQRGWAKPWMFSQSAQTLFLDISGGQFLCMFWERFINLGLLCRALGFGRILRVWGAPKGGQPHGGWDGQWMGFSVIPLWEGKLSFVLHMLPLHEPVISFGFHCVDSKQDGICWRDGGLEKAPLPDAAKQRHCSSGSCPAPGGRRVSFRREGSSRAAGRLPFCLWSLS